MNPPPVLVTRGSSSPSSMHTHSTDTESVRLMLMENSGVPSILSVVTVIQPGHTALRTGLTAYWHGPVPAL